MSRGSKSHVQANFFAQSVLACAASFLCLAAPPTAATQDKPQGKIDLECRVFAIASDGRIACAAHRVLKFRHYDIERDDIWLANPDGKRKKIVDGEKLVRSELPFSYTIRRLAFSPDGHRLTVEMVTEQVVDSEGNTREGELVDLMTDDGKEIEVAGTKTSVVEDAIQANWLADGQTVAYLLRPAEGDLLYRIGTVRPQGGRGSPIFDGHFFTAVAWDTAHNSAIAIERDKALSGPIKLVRLDLLHESDELITTLDAYLGQLSLSPSGDKVAYFRDGDTLEVRSLAAPQSVVSVHCAYGKFAWAADEQRILLKRGSEKETNDIVWVAIPSGNFSPILHDLIFRDFAFSPSSHTIVVAEPGTYHLQIYPLQ